MQNPQTQFPAPRVRIAEDTATLDMLTVLRDRNTSDQLFRQTMDEMAPLLLSEALQILPQRIGSVDTLLQPNVTVNQRAHRSFTTVQILGAGLAFNQAIVQLARRPDTTVRQALLCMSRDHDTHMPTLHYGRLPEQISADDVTIVFEPMWATSTSLGDGIDEVKSVGAQNIICVGVIASEEGVEVLQKRHLDVHYFTAAVDPDLDGDKYIVPGLGDFGDRYLGIEPRKMK